MKRHHALLLLLVTLWTGALLAGPGDPMEFIQLKGRTADEMVPLLKSLLKPGDTLTGTGYQLIIRTDPKTLREVRAVLDQLDRKQRNLLISVRRGKAANEQRREINASGTVKLGEDVRVGAGNSSKEGVVVRMQDRITTARDSGVQQLRVLEGNRAFIRSGQDVPYRENQVVVTPRGTVINKGTRYRSVDRGFYVLPRISGDRVTLSINAADGKLLPNRNIAVQEADTVVQGRIGEWIRIGGSSEESRSSSRGILSTQDHQGAYELDIYVKVEPD